MNKHTQGLAAFIERNKDALLREWVSYGHRPDVDYCPHDNGGCGHAHTFDAYCQREHRAFLHNQAYQAVQK